MTKVSTVPDPLNSTAYTAPFLTVSGGSSPVSTDITRTQGVTSPSAPTITAPTTPVGADQQRHGFALVQPEQLSDDGDALGRLLGHIRVKRLDDLLPGRT